MMPFYWLIALILFGAISALLGDILDYRFGIYATLNLCVVLPIWLVMMVRVQERELKHR